MVHKGKHHGGDIMTAEALSKEFDVLYSQMTPEKKKFVYLIIQGAM